MAAAKAGPFAGIKVRTVTAFCVGSSPEAIERAVRVARLAEERIAAAGYTVQTRRVIFSPFAEWAPVGDATAFSTEIARVRAAIPGDFRVCIGTAKTPAEVELIPDAIAVHGVSASALVTVDALGVPDAEMALASGKACARIAACTPGGEGNFSFSANASPARLMEFAPFFPSGYCESDCGASGAFSLGLEMPGLLVAALRTRLPAGAASVVRSPASRSSDLAAACDAMRAALVPHYAALGGICAGVAAETGVPFRGIDGSAAPHPTAAPLTELYTLLGVPGFGAAGTLEASAFLTRVLKGVAGEGVPPLIGYSGLMLAPLEDVGLAAARVEGAYSIAELLSYSAVCGIGLDTVPVPGDISPEAIARLVSDTTALAYRLHKPLSVRLFPVPGLAAGARTAFTNPDLCQTTVFEVA